MTDNAESQTDEQRAVMALIQADLSDGKRVAIIVDLIRQSRAEGANSVMGRAVELYNEGYMRGHDDTVESCFTDIHRSDMTTYHNDVVADLLNDGATNDTD